MDDDFDVASAVDEISGGLGLELDNDNSSDDTSDDVKLDSLDTGAAENSDDKVETPAAEEKPTETAAPAPSAKVAPRTWRAEAIAGWDTLPENIKDEVLKREDDMFKGIESYKSDATFGKTVQNIFAPYQAMLQAQNINPLAVVDNYMKMQHVMLVGTQAQKQATIRNVIKAYNVDFNVNEVPPEAPYVDPQVQTLQQQLQALESRQQALDLARQEEIRGGIRKELDAFSADPKNPYFLEVADDITTLLKSGVKTLAEAYEKAVWANPVTRAKEQARVTAEQVAKAQKESTEHAQAAKKSTAANVKSKPRSGSGTAPLGSIDDTLAETFRAIQSRRA
jgi:hypothetical protein